MNTRHSILLLCLVVSLVSLANAQTPSPSDVHVNSPNGRDVLSSTKLTSSSQRLEIIVNDKLRFDSPGRYVATVTTRRVTQTSC